MPHIRFFLALLLALIFAAPSEAGEFETDVGFHAVVCSNNLSSIDWELTKVKGASYSAKAISAADHADLLDAAATSRSTFDATASTLLGGWWTSLPQTTEDPAKDALYVLYGGLEGTCPT